MNNKALTALLVAALAAGMASMGSAQPSEDAEETATYTVSIDSTTAIDVQPTSLSYQNVEVGSQTTSSTTDNNYNALELENIGSEYVDTAWVNSTIPTSDPFGSGSADSYDAGNFVQLKPANDTGILYGDEDDYHYVNRIEYMQDASAGDVPSYIQWDGDYDGSNADSVYVGRFRMGSEERFFAIASLNGPACDGSQDDDLMRVANTSRSDTQRGTIDFTDTGNDFVEYNISSPGAGVYGITGSGESTPNGVILEKNQGTPNEVNRTYDVMTRCQPSGSQSPHVIRTRYNVGAAGKQASDGDASQYLIDADNEDRALAPGDSVTLETAIEVPNGVAQGDVSPGTLRVLVTSDTGFTTS